MILIADKILVEILEREKKKNIKNGPFDTVVKQLGDAFASHAPIRQIDVLTLNF